MSVSDMSDTVSMATPDAMEEDGGPVSTGGDFLSPPPGCSPPDHGMQRLGGS